jgi:hypothetical protein
MTSFAGHTRVNDWKKMGPGFLFQIALHLLIQEYIKRVDVIVPRTGIHLQRAGIASGTTLPDLQPTHDHAFAW